MKKFLLILAMGLMLLPSFGRKVIVLEVTKEGDGWQNLFNLYREVTTTYVGNQNGVPCVNLTCTGAGYSWCRASREIGEMNFGMSPNDARTVLSNEQIVNVSVAVCRRVAVVEGDVMAAAGVTVEDHLFLHPCAGGTARINRINRYEGAEIGRIGHHTHNQTIGAVGCFVHEGRLQRVDRDGGVKLRRDGDIVVTGRAIEIEGTYAFIVRGTDVGQ